MAKNQNQLHPLAKAIVKNQVFDMWLSRQGGHKIDDLNNAFVTVEKKRHDLNMAIDEFKSLIVDHSNNY